MLNPRLTELTDDKGASSDYAFEGSSIGELMRRFGWTKSSVAPGDKVIVGYLPFKDGKKRGRLEGSGGSLMLQRNIPGARPPIPCPR